MHHVDPSEDKPARQAVYETFADRSRSVEAATEHALQIGIDRFGVDVGFLTEIADGQQRIVQTVGAHERITIGEACSLDRAYCRETVERDSPLAVQEAAISPDISGAAYDEFGLSTYIGGTVSVDGETYGTVCFADDRPRAEPFTEADQLFVELVARLVGQGIERRRHERELYERAERLRKENERVQRIADTAFDLLFEIDPDATLTYVSPGIQNMLGYSPEEVDGTPFVEYLTPASETDAVDAFEQVFTGEPIRNLELTVQRADGETAVLEINGTPVFEDGAVVAAHGVARDVTVRHEREAELRVKTRAIDDATVGIVISDATAPDNPVRYVNRAFEELTGYSSESILGGNCRILQGSKTDEAVVADVREAIGAAEPVSVDLLNYRRDGSPFWNDVQVEPVTDENGDVSHFVGFQADATDRVRTNSLIELLNRVLRHNLRNELNVLHGYGELLTDPEAAARADVDPGAIIHGTVDNLTSLSDSVRELEQIARQDRNPTRLDVSGLVSEAVSRAHETSPGATIEARIELDADRGICAGVELGRALEELIENALRHDTDPPTTVTVTARAVGDDVELVVADDGPGIPPVEASVIEAGRETAVEHGSGLGLWLVNWIVTRYGGSFQLRAADEDDETSGTVAVVSLPGLDPDDDPTDVVRPHTTLFK